LFSNGLLQLPKFSGIDAGQIELVEVRRIYFIDESLPPVEICKTRKPDLKAAM